MIRLNERLRLEPQRVNSRYLPNHHYEYENVEKTGYPGVSRRDGSHTNGASHGLHPRDSASGFPQARQKTKAAGDGANPKSAPAASDPAAWLLAWKGTS